VAAPGNTASRSIQRSVGTIPFLSPEQGEPPKEGTTRSDVYGLGAIRYALLTGRPPFRGENVEKTLQLVRESTPELPRVLNPRVDLDLQAVCLKCLQKDPARRYRSAEGLARDRERWLDGKETEARRWGLVEKGQRACRRYPIAAARTATGAACQPATRSRGPRRRARSPGSLG